MMTAQPMTGQSQLQSLWPCQLAEWQAQQQRMGPLSRHNSKYSLVTCCPVLATHVLPLVHKYCYGFGFWA